ncbi:MAG: C1 family peptidase [Polyangiaceae bacterium]
MLSWRLWRPLLLATLPLGMLTACSDDIDSNEADVTDVANSKVKNQSIGNCWVYASIGWAESLHLTQTGIELNLSESWISYWHWYEQIAGAPKNLTRVASLENGKIGAGGFFGVAAEIMRRYGVIPEGSFIPEEAEAARSSRQSSALAAINESLTNGALKTAAARKDRKLVRKELDKAWGLSTAVSANIDSVFGADVSKTLLTSGLTIPTATGIIRPKDIPVGHSITLADAIGEPSSSTNVLKRTGKYAWNEQSYPTTAKDRREFFRKMQRSLNVGMPVIMVWYVDFNALDSQNRFMQPPATPGHQGGHMTVLEDYQVSNVPGYGTLAAGTLVTDNKALEASLDEKATIDFVRIKNSWGTSLAPPNASNDLRGYYDIYKKYLDGPLTKCTESNGDKCGTKTTGPGITSMVFPPDAFVTDALVKEGACSDICVAGPARSPSCDPCTDLICSEDAYCCANAWDATCIQTANEICDQGC